MPPADQTDTTVDSDHDQLDAGTPPDGETGQRGGGARRRVRLLATLGVASVVLVAAAVVLAVGNHAARANGALANQAFVDPAATADVVGQISTAIKTVYSYDYRALAANEAAAKAVITGKFVDEFAQTFEPVKQLAPAQQAVLTTAVPAVGVALLRGDRARLLMMVDQRGTRGQSQQLAGATARLVVDAQRVDGRWKIAEVTPE
ncbi:MAG: hypothetical protein JO100_14070 [Pseudonocardia sp.]|nr:hypothetical protein [Pseudonocardia sp.]